MKVHIRLDGRVEVVDGVSVDATCLPLVSGARPYDSAAKDSSPLVQQSALWFKTLAVTALYIDCSRRLIYWTPGCTADIQDVQLRASPAPVSGSQDFIPCCARPLFQDNSVYDFDASLKEMMLKCFGTTQKFRRKFMSVDEFHKTIARLLHIYILPSIHFTRDDIASLLQVKCQIEERLVKIEEDIKAKAIVKENVKICLDKMLNKLLCEENFDSEHYLRTCDRDFLTAVLKVVECNVAALNTDLSAIQNMVNWVRDHPGHGQKLADLKARRDQIFADVDQRIQVRETIKNVAFRRDLSKRKNKCKVTKSCVHNMFTEVVKQLELQESSMQELGDGKVSICAAREAVLYALSNLADSNQPSASSLQSEPDKLASFSVDDSQTDRSNCWLPLAAQVATTLENKKSVAYMCHEYGCQKLSSQTVHILKDFLPAKIAQESIHSSWTQTQSIHSSRAQTQSIQPHVVDVQPCDQHQETLCDDLSCQFSLSLSEVTMRQPKLVSQAGYKREAIYLSKSSKWWTNVFHQPDICDADMTGMSCDSGLSQESIQSSGTPTQSIQPSMVDVQPCDELDKTSYDDVNCQFGLSLSEVPMRQPKLVIQAGHKQEAMFLQEDKDQWKSSFHQPDICGIQLSQTERVCCAPRDDRPEDYIMVSGYRGTISSNDVFTETESSVEVQQSPGRQMTLSGFMDAVEELKGQIQAHLTEVIDLLGQETSESDDLTLKEQQEILWKSYDRFFSQELYSQLWNLYTIGLTPGIRLAYAELRNLSVLEILKGDRLLTLFFGPSVLRGRASPIPIPRPSKYTTAVNVTHDFDDFSFGVGRCNVIEMEASQHRDQAVRTESSGSVTHSIDEGFYQASGSFSSSLRSTLSSDSLNENADEMWEYTFGPRKVEDKLGSVLSPFMKFVGVCLNVECFSEKIRYITKAIEGLNDSISVLFGSDFQSTCDDIISMLVLALCNIPENMFVSLYVDLRLLMDVLPDFFFGSRWDFHLVSLYSAYNYLFTLKISDHIIHKF
ncbi:unnamed protein product [Candidula unifasciata]|uniref:VPS9 domain-containing protein n=1 Tax=Candidula unifasciata TaxID=100452 RepID=A0A8S3YIU0_9EUPU|nr:unnamed protein product [Candidula unifasciata]